MRKVKSVKLLREEIDRTCVSIKASREKIAETLQREDIDNSMKISLKFADEQLRHAEVDLEERPGNVVGNRCIGIIKNALHATAEFLKFLASRGGDGG